MCVCDIHESLKIPQSKASRHLAYLSARRGWLTRAVTDSGFTIAWRHAMNRCSLPSPPPCITHSRMNGTKGRRASEDTHGMLSPGAGGHALGGLLLARDDRSARRPHPQRQPPAVEIVGSWGLDGASRARRRPEAQLMKARRLCRVRERQSRWPRTSTAFSSSPRWIRPPVGLAPFCPAASDSHLLAARLRLPNPGPKASRTVRNPVARGTPHRDLALPFPKWSSQASFGPVYLDCRARTLVQSSQRPAAAVDEPRGRSLAPLSATDAAIVVVASVVQARVPVSSCLLTRRTPDGTDIWVEVSGKPVSGDDGQCEGAVLTLVDAGDRVRAGRALEQRQGRARGDARSDD